MKLANTLSMLLNSAAGVGAMTQAQQENDGLRGNRPAADDVETSALWTTSRELKPVAPTSCLPTSFVVAGAGQCQQKAAYGIISTTGQDCITLGGAMNGVPGDLEWTACHLDFCSGESTINV